MAAFSPDGPGTDAHDFGLARHGGLAKYLNVDVLTDSERALQELGYVLVRMDAKGWGRERVLHQDFASALSFPAWYGQNLDALDDCLSDVAAGGYGWDVTRTGLAVTVHGVGPFARKHAALACSVVDALARTSREAMLYGHRILWLLHVDDPSFCLPPVNAVEVPWNDCEWMDARRR